MSTKLDTIAQVAIAEETTPGVPETLGVADAGIRVMNPRWVSNAERQARRYASDRLGFDPAPLGSMSAELTFTMEIDPGTSPDLDRPLRAAGWTTTAADVYTLQGAPEKTYTIGLYRDGTLKVMAGSVGGWRMVWNAGETAKVEFTFMGHMPQDPSEEPLLSGVTYDAGVPPAIKGANLIVDGHGTVQGLKVLSLEIEGGNQVSLTPDMNQDTGLCGAHMGQREVRGRLLVEESLTYNWFAKAQEDSLKEMTLAIRNSAGDACSVSAGIQWDYPADEEQETRAILALPLYFAKEAINGEVTMTFTDAGP